MTSRRAIPGEAIVWSVPIGGHSYHASLDGRSYACGRWPAQRHLGNAELTTAPWPARPTTPRHTTCPECWRRLAGPRKPATANRARDSRAAQLRAAGGTLAAVGAAMGISARRAGELVRRHERRQTELHAGTGRSIGRALELLALLCSRSCARAVLLSMSSTARDGVPGAVEAKSPGVRED